MINKIRNTGNKININIDNIEFEGVPDNLSSSFLNRLIFIIDGKYNIVNFDSKGKITTFDETRKIYDITGNVLLIKYDNNIILNKDKNLFDKNFIKEGFFSKRLKDGRQVPENYGNFEYKGKFYLILKANNKTIDEKTLYSFNGIIVNPELYFGKVENHVDNIEDKIKDIL